MSDGIDQESEEWQLLIENVDLFRTYISYYTRAYNAKPMYITAMADVYGSVNAVAMCDALLGAMPSVSSDDESMVISLVDRALALSQLCSVARKVAKSLIPEGIVPPAGAVDAALELYHRKAASTFLLR